jgi:hypothetical protein
MVGDGDGVSEHVPKKCHFTGNPCNEDECASWQAVGCLWIRWLEAQL